MNNNIKTVPSPLYRDPIYDGATDPTIIFNSEENNYWMFYTQRRSTEFGIGVSTIHGTKIGIASSDNGIDWLYRGTLDNLEFEPGTNTFWAPEVVYAKGEYHMYVSYVPGVPTDWNHPRYIVHYTANNLWNWTFQSVLNLSSDKVIDACVYEIEPDLFKMWYKDERDNSHSYAAISHDLYNWEVVGPEITDVPHEGPNVFTFQNRHWMLTDFWNGLGVYETSDFKNWTRRADILQEPGTRTDDGQIGHHADVVVNSKGEAYVFYFVHPEFDPVTFPKGQQTTYKENRTVIQVGKLELQGDNLVINRNQIIETETLF